MVGTRHRLRPRRPVRHVFDTREPLWARFHSTYVIACPQERGSGVGRMRPDMRNHTAMACPDSGTEGIAERLEWEGLAILLGVDVYYRDNYRRRSGGGSRRCYWRQGLVVLHEVVANTSRVSALLVVRLALDIALPFADYLAQHPISRRVSCSTNSNSHCNHKAHLHCPKST